MNDISRRDLDSISKRLRMYGADEDFILADRLEKADIIPKLYQRAYVESLYQRLKVTKTPHQIEQSLGSYDTYLSHLIWHNETIDAVQEILYKAHMRQEEICDFDDSVLPTHIIGRCQYENHNENHENIELTEDEQKIFDKIDDQDGSDAAWEHFEDKINPNTQKLTLTLTYTDDETKVSKDDGEYVCEGCMEEIADNADGITSCDMEFVD